MKNEYSISFSAWSSHISNIFDGLPPSVRNLPWIIFKQVVVDADWRGQEIQCCLFVGEASTSYKERANADQNAGNCQYFAPWPVLANTTTRVSSQLCVAIAFGGPFFLSDNLPSMPLEFLKIWLTRHLLPRDSIKCLTVLPLYQRPKWVTGEWDPSKLGQRNSFFSPPEHIKSTQTNEWNCHRWSHWKHPCWVNCLILPGGSSPPPACWPT